MFHPYLISAQRGTRTLKPFGMRPSNARVYQFRHLRAKYKHSAGNTYALILPKKHTAGKRLRYKGYFPAGAVGAGRFTLSITEEDARW